MADENGSGLPARPPRIVSRLPYRPAPRLRVGPGSPLLPRLSSEVTGLIASALTGTRSPATLPGFLLLWEQLTPLPLPACPRCRPLSRPGPSVPPQMARLQRRRSIGSIISPAFRPRCLHSVGDRLRHHLHGPRNLLGRTPFRQDVRHDYQLRRSSARIPWSAFSAGHCGMATAQNSAPRATAESWRPDPASMPGGIGLRAAARAGRRAR
jgi:hypothetical protein